MKNLLFIYGIGRVRKQIRFEFLESAACKSAFKSEMASAANALSPTYYYSAIIHDRNFGCKCASDADRGIAFGKILIKKKIYTPLYFIAKDGEYLSLVLSENQQERKTDLRRESEAPRLCQK